MNAHLDLPFHPTTRLQAIGSGRRGWIWPVMGGAEDGGAGDQSNEGGEGEQEQQNNQDQAGGDGNDGGKGKAKRDPLYQDLPDDHPLVKRHEALKAEHKQAKAKAKIVDDAEEAKKTDAQKIADLQSKLDAQPKAVAEALREHLVDLHGIDKDDAELFLTGDTPELLRKQVTRLLEQGGGGSKRKNYVSKEGNPQRKPSENEAAKFASSLLGGSDD